MLECLCEVPPPNPPTRYSSEACTGHQSCKSPLHIHNCALPTRTLYFSMQRRFNWNLERQAGATNGRGGMDGKRFGTDLERTSRGVGHSRLLP